MSGKFIPARRQLARKMRRTARRGLRRIIPRRNAISPAADAQLRAIGLIPLRETLPEDIFLAGYPKSGNTWMQNLVVALLYGIDLEKVPYTFIHELVPGPRRRYYRRYSTPALFKTHDLPKPQHRRVIYIVRDGRDVMVSYQHFYNTIHRTSKTALELLQDKRLYPSQWHRHVRRWLNNPHGADLLIVKYEDLKRDTVGELRRLCAFMGLERDEAALQHAAAQGAFDAMRQREQVFGMENPRWPKDASFVRSGQIGGHTKDLPPDALEYFMRKAAPVMAQLGYIASEPPQATPIPNPSPTAP
jgi:hypothetical protein